MEFPLIKKTNSVGNSNASLTLPIYMDGRTGNVNMWNLPQFTGSVSSVKNRFDSLLVSAPKSFGKDATLQGRSVEAMGTGVKAAALGREI